jgi:hypothetical protein
MAACGDDDSDDSAADEAESAATEAVDEAETAATEAVDEAETAATEAMDDAETAATDAMEETDSTDGGDEAATGDFECETALNDDNSVESISELDFSGVDVTVGSKDFTEQFVLGALAVVAMEEAGANVDNQLNLGGTVVNRDALLAGEIDTYWEYNGTGWTVHLGRDDPSFDRAELTNDVCVTDLEENNIRWIGVSEFNDTYGFATAGDSPAAGLDLQGMMEYVNENSDATVCMEDEYPSRPDGLVLVDRADDPRVADRDPRHRPDLRGDGQRQLHLRRDLHHRRADPGAGPRRGRGPGHPHPLQRVAHDARRRVPAGTRPVRGARRHDPRRPRQRHDGGAQPPGRRGR